MKLVIKQLDADGRLGLLEKYLTTAWTFAVVDPENPAAFARALADADAIISMDWRPSPPAPQLKLLQLPGAGADAIDFDSVPRNTAICNVYGHEVSIAEFVIATLLEVTIGVRKMDAALRRNNWYGSYLCGPRHGHVYGRTLGIVGYGRIGREVARRAAAFGMRVIAVNRTAREPDEWVERVDNFAQLDELLRAADYVLIGMPLDDSTRGLIDARRLAQMKPSAVIINPSRGPIIDEAALYHALRERKIGGAVIDTWYNYPAQGHDQAAPARFAFNELDNIIMTPHASAWTEHLRDTRCAGIAENLNRLARGQPLTNIVRAPL